LKSKYTLRHSAGAEKYRSLSKWEKRRPGYEAKLKERAEKAAAKAAAKAERASIKTAFKKVKTIKKELKKATLNEEEKELAKVLLEM
jgi:hypothetical protein